VRVNLNIFISFLTNSILKLQLKVKTLLCEENNCQDERDVFHRSNMLWTRFVSFQEERDEFIKNNNIVLLCSSFFPCVGNSNFTDLTEV